MQLRKGLVASIFLFSAVAALIFFACPAGAQLDLTGGGKQEGACDAGEKMNFGCRLADGRWVSLCSSQVLNKRTGWFYFRLGSPGAAEIQHPDKKDRPEKHFTYYRFSRFQEEKMFVRFTKGGAKYEVYSFILPSGPKAGLKIVGGADYVCSGAPKGDLRTLEQLLPNDKN